MLFEGEANLRLAILRWGSLPGLAGQAVQFEPLGDLVAGCEIVTELGTLDRRADELKCAATAWVHGVGRLAGRRPPDYAYDVHTGHGSDQDWWEQVNALWADSQWQADAMASERWMSQVIRPPGLGRLKPASH